MGPFKLSLTLSLYLLTLPSLFLSLIIFSFLSFFLLLPLAWALFSIHLLCSILSRIPLISPEIYAPKYDATMEDRQRTAHQVELDCIELDCSEIPRSDESSSSSSSSLREEKEKFTKELEEMDHEQFCQLFEMFRWIENENDGFITFAEILAFWRSKEKQKA